MIGEATANGPVLTMGMRSDRSPWVIGVDFGGAVTIGAYGELRADRKELTVDEARARANALLAAVEWIEAKKTEAIESSRGSVADA